MAITTEQIYLLNKMNSIANKVQLGTLIYNAENVTAGEIALTEGSVLVGNSSDVGAALDASGDTKVLVGNGTTITSVALSGEATMTNAGVVTVGTLANCRVTDSTTSSYYLSLVSDGDGGTPLTGNKSITFDVYDGDRTIDLQGNLSIGGNASLAGSLTLAGAWTHTGAHTVDITTTANTAITLPTTGTLLTTAAANIFTDNQTIDNQKELRFREATAGGTNYMGFKAAAAMAGDVDYTLPAADATGVWKSDGAGALSIATIVDADVAGGAAIATSKLADATQIGYLALGGTITTGDAWTQTGAHTVGITTSGATAITLPTTGTLATIAGSETFTNKTLTDPVIGTTTYKEATGTLSQTDLNSNIGAGVEAIAAPGAGVAIIVDSVELFHDYDSAQYTNAYDLNVVYGSSGQSIMEFADTIVTAAADDKVIAKPTVYDLDNSTGTSVGYDLDTNAANNAIQFKADTGNYGGGAAGNIVKYKIRYHEITLLT